jgi:excisionase family DNA binding protein
MHPRKLPPEVVAAVSTLVDFIESTVRAAVEQAQGGEAVGDYYDAKSAPMGPTSFLRLAREGAFPACKVGRKVLARRSDVDAWLGARAGERATTRATVTICEDDGAPLDPLVFHEAIVASATGRPALAGQRKRRGRGRVNGRA